MFLIFLLKQNWFSLFFIWIKREDIDFVSFQLNPYKYFDILDTLSTGNSIDANCQVYKAIHFCVSLFVFTEVYLLK